jgi:hypothetical protein
VVDGVDAFATPNDVANVHEDWELLDHGPLEPLADNLWRVTGALPGMSLQRTMTIVRRTDGSLVLHSVICMREAQMRELERLGTPGAMIVPNQGHRLDAPAYKKRYRGLRVYTPAGGREKVAAVVPVDGAYEDFPSDDDVRLEMLHGVKDGEGAMIVRSRDGVTVVLNDAMHNMDKKRDLLGRLFTTLMGSAPGPRVSRTAKLFFIEDQAALRRDLLRYAEMPELVRLIVAHENVAHGPDAAAALREAATYLKTG